MSYKTHDELGYPIGYSTEGFYTLPEERYLYLPASIYNSAPDRYMVSTWGHVLDTFRNTIVPKNLSSKRNVYKLCWIQRA